MTHNLVRHLMVGLFAAVITLAVVIVLTFRLGADTTTSATVPSPLTTFDVEPVGGISAATREPATLPVVPVVASSPNRVTTQPTTVAADTTTSSTVGPTTTASPSTLPPTTVPASTATSVETTPPDETLQTTTFTTAGPTSTETTDVLPEPTVPDTTEPAA